MSLPITVDFESGAIASRPEYPPRPVGVAISIPGKKPKYWGFAHPTNNSCSEDEARQALGEVWDKPLLFHNANFDYAIATERWGFPKKPWNTVHDTMFLLFLDNPHALSYSLKPAAEHYLGEAPTEQDAVRDWLVSHKVCRSNDKKFGRFICEAPGDVVGPYAIGDVTRTQGLFKLLMPRIKKEGMAEAYNRERELAPILLTNEQEGMRIDVSGLSRDVEIYTGELAKVEKWIRKALKAPGLNLDADREVAAALEGHIKQWTYTATGQKSVSKVNLKPEHFVDQQLASAMGYRTRLMTCMNTFMQPWLEMAVAAKGRIHPSWHQTRGDNGGTRTGRLSCSAPNLQNIPKSFEDKNDGYVHPKHLKVLPLPLIRKYVLPEEGHVILHRDYSSQELRILAHYEEGSLMRAYQENVDLDPHNFIRGEIERIANLKLDRRPVKITVFTSIYGGGIPKLAEQLNSTVEKAGQIKTALRASMPDVDVVDRDLKSLWRKGQSFQTWGGRVYYSQPPSNGKTYEYKALNTLIQSGAADVSKQSVINYHNAKQHGRFVLTCHDENNVSVLEEHQHSEMKILKEAMESIPLSVYLKTDGARGANWGELQKW